MIHKPIEGKHPNGLNALDVLQSHLRRTRIRHLRAGEQKIEGDCFIPEPWLLRGYVLCPNITNQGLLFRGQTVDLDEKGEIPPTLSRFQKLADDKTSMQYWRMRRFDLNNLLRTNPLYRLLTWGIELPDKRQRYFRISTSTMLHSYGIPSNYVSLTSDLKIALFFAVTDYDSEKECFVPSKKKFGILSSYEMDRHFSPRSRVLPVGLQVFQRPGVNKEFVCRLSGGENYNDLMEVTGFLFEQDEKVSKQLLLEFDDGRKLFPKEDVLLNQINKSDGIISEMALRWIQRMGMNSNIDVEALKKKYEITNDVRDILRFDVRELADYYGDIDKWWHNFCDKIYFEADPNLDRDFFEWLPQSSYYGRIFDRLRP